jgi:hypothetical protein
VDSTNEANPGRSAFATALNLTVPTICLCSPAPNVESGFPPGRREGASIIEVQLVDFAVFA